MNLGVCVDEGEIYFLNRYEARRRRSASRSSKRAGARGLALDCGNSCYFRLHRNSSKENDPELRIHLFRWRQFPMVYTPGDSFRLLRKYISREIRPVVQYVDSNKTMRTRLSRVAPSCIYSAHVKGTTESSIVNLCDNHGGLFGTLVLPDGTYIIEPVASRTVRGEQSTRKAHLVYKARSLSFQNYDYSTPKSSGEVFDGTILPTDVNMSVTPVILSNDTLSSSLSSLSLSSKNTFDINVFLLVQQDFSNYLTIFAVRSNRSRRSANSWDYYVEVLAVADYSMFLYHQNNLENYLLTLFSTVIEKEAASIYRHPSLNAAINIVLVKITVLKQRMPEFEGEVARDILSAFCRWQKHINDPNEDSLNHHDVALFLTRNDLCRGAGQCDTLGLAELGMMCEPEKSCAIIEDNGLSTGFTITHELGHIFNLPHDQDEPCSQYTLNQPSNFHIMAKTVRYDTHPWSWSLCSSAVLAKFLDLKRYRTQCLLDPPIEKRYHERVLDMPPPGAMFSADQQCKFLFGSHARHCTLEAALMENETCTRLWCEGYFVTGRGVITNGCRTHYLPWADGTPCGPNKWCNQGKCVGLSFHNTMRQDGGWGEWGQWGDCSRTCGGGVQQAIRKCDSPRPSGGGKYCIGQRERYRSCNILDCPLDTPGFREVQCSSFDYKNTGIHGVSRNARWIPRYDGVSLNERCKLYCHEHGKSAFYLLNAKVIDGTPCDRNTDDICIDGTCHKAGCDHRLGSDVRRDRCGICGGDNSSCRLVTGTYNQRGHYGYTEVVKIPAGSSAIEITQRSYKNRKEDDNYLALRNGNNEFILNGNYQVSVYPVQVTVQKAVLWYSGSDNIIERINGSGPIRTDLYLHVLSVGRLYPPDIHYQYMVPIGAEKHSQKTSSSSYYWRKGESWSECSAICQGQQVQSLICTDRTTGRDAPNEYCTSRPPAVQSRICNLDCVIKWRSVGIGPCSVTCGHGEMRQRSECIRQFNDGREEAVPEKECRNLQKPSDRKACYQDCAGRKWAYSEWSTCSETCGNSGIMQRRAICVDQNSRPIDEKLCERAAREITEKECNRIPCPKWVYSAWSECSRSCDGGVRVRHASCQDAAGREISAVLCNINEKHDRESCNEHLCTQWQFGPWSTCSVTCGDGVQVRDAVCVDRDGRHLDSGRCNSQHRHVLKQCHLSTCPRWRLGGWSSCSVSCGDGWKTRRVACVDASGNEITNEQCLGKGETRPLSHEKCNLGSCAFWRVSDWSQCSVSCGVGVRTRRAECVHNDKIADRQLCVEAKKPKTEEACHLYACAHWESSSWTSCSVTCGRGTQTRIVQCVNNGGTKSNSPVLTKQCDSKTRPASERVCQLEPCQSYYSRKGTYREPSRIRWEAGRWSECSKSCGSGTQRRLVRCRYDNREVSDEYCKNMSRPASMQNCQNKPCAECVRRRADLTLLQRGL
ncbi:unnamed protein product [Enterobius vermicularis]|uniref:Peptidase M12B domain-containing protein n=1 Tax=Enterobius vermicularis TaxID=51028 RepID=A0A3P6IRP0_ENTVE|nr:unnamed protein product [Enterobius vermicularis]